MRGKCVFLDSSNGICFMLDFRIGYVRIGPSEEFIGN